jgi:type II secretory pathway predicted ATPase ExeA
MMDWTRFGMRRRPFSATPDTAAYYPAASHEHALSRLQDGLTNGEGLALLTSAPGLGKTLVGRVLMQRLDLPEAACATVTNCHLANCAALLQAILFDLALPFAGMTEQEMRLTLTAHLLQTAAAAAPTLILVDEAHHLAPNLLEELRLLTNLEADGVRALRVILSGQPILLETLNRPELSSLRQRLGLRVELQPLDVHESADFLVHQVRAAGGNAEAIFTDEAIETLVGATAGVPRLLNQAAWQAMNLCSDVGALLVDVEAVFEALAVLGISMEEQEPRLMLSEELNGDESLDRVSA